MSYNIRHKDFLDVSNYHKPVAIIGCGSIGSILGLTLVKLGFTNFILFDDDIVNPENIGVQFHNPDTIGLLKTEALEQTLRKENPKISVEKFGKFTDRTKFSKDSSPEIIISCVDSLEARLNIWKTVKRLAKTHYIDTRMGLQTLEVYYVDPQLDNKTFYTESLNVQTRNVRCTEKSVIFTPQIIAGMVGKLISRIIKQEPVNCHFLHFDIRDLWAEQELFYTLT